LIWLKPKHLKHFVLEVLFGDLVLEGEGLSLEVCGVDSLEELEGLSYFGNYFYPSKISYRRHHYEYV